MEKVIISHMVCGQMLAEEIAAETVTLLPDKIIQCQGIDWQNTVLSFLADIQNGITKLGFVNEAGGNEFIGFAFDEYDMNGIPHKCQITLL